VADSDPAAEDTECRNKAMAVLRAVATAETCARHECVDVSSPSAVLLSAVGGGLVLMAVGQLWATSTAAAPGLPLAVERWPGSRLEPVVRPLGLLGVAGCLAVLATRGIARLLVGVLLSPRA
jgi:hypothetical protein